MMCSRLPSSFVEVSTSGESTEPTGIKPLVPRLNNTTGPSSVTRSPSAEMTMLMKSGIEVVAISPAGAIRPLPSLVRSCVVFNEAVKVPSALISVATV